MKINSEEYERRKKYFIKYRLENKKRRNEYSKKHREENPSYYKNWRIKNRKKMKKYFINYNIEYKEIRNKKIRERLKTNPNFKILRYLRTRICCVLKGKNKSANTMTLLGIPNVEFLWNYLEKQFKPGMTRKNHGKWHLDHMKPCSSFDLTKPEEQAECFHYTNLQPLWASENLSKGNRIS